MWIVVFILLACIAYMYFNAKCERCEGLSTCKKPKDPYSNTY